MAPTTTDLEKSVLLYKISISLDSSLPHVCANNFYQKKKPNNIQLSFKISKYDTHDSFQKNNFSVQLFGSQQNEIFSGVSYQAYDLEIWYC